MSKKPMIVRTLPILNVRSGQAESDSWYHPAHELKEGTSSGALILASQKAPVVGEDGTLRFEGPVVIARTSGGSAAVVSEKAIPSVRAYLQGLVADPAAGDPMTLEQAREEAQEAYFLKHVSKESRAMLSEEKLEETLAIFRSVLDPEQIEKDAKELIRKSRDGMNRLTAKGIANRKK